MDVFVRDAFTMIAAPVQCDVDGISKGSHHVRVPIAIGENLVGAFAPECLTETKLTAGRGCGVGLRLAYWVAQVCNADARNHRRIAKDDWRAGEAVEESNSGAKEYRRDVDVDFVEEPSVQ